MKRKSAILEVEQDNNFKYSYIKNRLVEVHSFTKTLVPKESVMKNVFTKKQIEYLEDMFDDKLTPINDSINRIEKLLLSRK